MDLSHALLPGQEEYPLALEIHDTTELYPQYPKDKDVWYILSNIHVSSHCGTHVEFPYHHNRRGLDAGSFPLRRLVSPAVLLDFRHKLPDQPVTLAELCSQEQDIRPGDAKILDANTQWMKANPKYLVLIEGHADERGTNEYNLALGERRAKATLSYLVSQGVQATRFTLISYGEERPQCTEKTEACWARNRRAHFLVKAQ